MRTLSPFLAVCLSLSCASLSPSQDTAPKPAPAATSATQTELEAEFTKMLTEATLTGRWCGIKDGHLTEEKEESYTITSVTKIEGDKWTVNARIKYKSADFPIAIPAKVNWAGDTAVMTVADLAMPGGSTYWARVIFHKHTYAGTWGSGGESDGLINGIITQKSP
ncbi:MAG TPA: hypothetical protein VLE43_14785 [Candidatus Saccharimonadia bacterium]|nr:hypothetical protein [Candidatus Saccharimonadia bacterium]